MHIKAWIQMINGYQDLPKFTKSSPVSMKIVSIDDIPVFQRAIRFPAKEQNVINAQVSDWVENNIVVESSSDYANNVVLVKKKEWLPTNMRLFSNAKSQNQQGTLPIINH